MSDLKDIFTNPHLRVGGYFELAIQVSPSMDNDSIPLYKEYFWNLPNVDGPFDSDMNPVTLSSSGYSEEGVVRLGELRLPFKTYNIKETEPIRTGFNWFDVSFFTTTIEHVFGMSDVDWGSKPEPPQELDQFLTSVMEDLFRIKPFLLAFKDFEISGQYYLQNLKTEGLQNWTNTHFFIPATEVSSIQKSYLEMVTVL